MHSQNTVSLIWKALLSAAQHLNDQRENSDARAPCKTFYSSLFLFAYPQNYQNYVNPTKILSYLLHYIKQLMRFPD